MGRHRVTLHGSAFHGLGSATDAQAGWGRSTSRGEVPARPVCRCRARAGLTLCGTVSGCRGPGARARDGSGRSIGWSFMSCSIGVRRRCGKGMAVRFRRVASSGCLPAHWPVFASAPARREARSCDRRARPGHHGRLRRTRRQVFSMRRGRGRRGRWPRWRRWGKPLRFFAPHTQRAASNANRDQTDRFVHPPARAPASSSARSRPPAKLTGPAIS
jgi:hypothetical protein